MLVFVAGGGTLPPALTKQLKASKVEERAPDSEKTQDVLADAVRAANLKLRPDAAKVVAAHLGQDAGRVAAFVEVLAAAYPAGRAALRRRRRARISATPARSPRTS